MTASWFFHPIFYGFSKQFYNSNVRKFDMFAISNNVKINMQACLAKNMENLWKFLEFDPGGGGVHDLRMDGGLPPGFQKGTLI